MTKLRKPVLHKTVGITSSVFDGDLSKPVSKEKFDELHQHHPNLSQVFHEFQTRVNFMEYEYDGRQITVGLYPNIDVTLDELGGEHPLMLIIHDGDKTYISNFSKLVLEILGIDLP